MAEILTLHPILSGLLFIAAVLSLRVVAGLWVLSKFASVPRVKKLLWSLVVLIPFVGPLFYGAFFVVPPPNGAGLGPSTSSAGTHLGG